ncbi:hypothetical protein [Jannaschia donghaensis]|uniref:Uncharacterized protein n=1 Tax=Jannaschia donghaensis TaxID=420998 RepID=A0A0M6YJA9_9RHOB|nr:hypothetical protein [Jannaschia donghaensis]CTQ49879.1 hypothetical protein JDO7802_01896 [Jannaschia donghaensis]
MSATAPSDIRTEPRASSAPDLENPLRRRRLTLRPGGSDAPTATRRPVGPSPIEIAALVFTLAWLGLVGWFFLTLQGDPDRITPATPLSVMTTILAVFLPVALVWVAVSAARTAQTMREESARLRTSMDTMRDSNAAHQKELREALSRDLDTRLAQLDTAHAVLAAELAALQRPAEPAPVLTAPARPAAPPPRQTTLALGTEPLAEPVPPEDFVRALNFPDNDRDLEGFEVLRRALRHHETARLVTASQDLLTLLAQDGIYMDDLTVHRADPVLWRAFADGTHGAEVAALGGIKDRSSLALTSGRMKDDTVFRDAVHHFLRTFDQVFPRFADIATDREIMAFADTRTARAFMVCARVAGTFD